MTDIVLCPPTPRTSRLAAIRDWLRHARVAASLGAAPPLPDRLLRDIGIEDGAAVADSTHATLPAVDVPTRLGLLDLGWQPPRRPRRR